MSEVKRYADRDIMQLDRDGNHYCNHVLAMTAEGLHDKSDIAAELAFRDAALDRVTAERDAYKARELQSRTDLAKSLADHFRKNAEISALQQRLTAADERADVLEGLVGEVLDAVGREPLDLDAVLRLRARMRAALKPAEGVGDDTTLEEDREDFKKVFVRINTKQGQSISLADMIARYEKKP